MESWNIFSSWSIFSDVIEPVASMLIIVWTVIGAAKSIVRHRVESRPLQMPVDRYNEIVEALCNPSIEEYAEEHTSLEDFRPSEIAGLAGLMELERAAVAWYGDVIKQKTLEGLWKNTDDILLFVREYEYCERLQAITKSLDSSSLEVAWKGKPGKVVLAPGTKGHAALKAIEAKSRRYGIVRLSDALDRAQWKVSPELRNSDFVIIWRKSEPISGEVSNLPGRKQSDLKASRKLKATERLQLLPEQLFSMDYYVSCQLLLAVFRERPEHSFVSAELIHELDQATKEHRNNATPRYRLHAEAWDITDPEDASAAKHKHLASLLDLLDRAEYVTKTPHDGYQLNPGFRTRTKGSNARPGAEVQWPKLWSLVAQMLNKYRDALRTNPHAKYYAGEGTGFPQPLAFQTKLWDEITGLNPLFTAQDVANDGTSMSIDAEETVSTDDSGRALRTRKLTTD